MASINKTLYDRIGGEPTLQKVHKIFYDKAYEHEWFKLYFTDKPQAILESQQTDFMAQLMGGPRKYAGKTPKMAHQHIHITEDLFRLRQFMLNDSLKEYGLADDLRKEWMQADATFHKALVKPLDSCEKAYPGQDILSFSKPENL